MIQPQQLLHAFQWYVLFVSLHQIEQFYSVISDSQSLFTQRHQIVRGCLSLLNSAYDHLLN